ncbi:hypothetical protein FAVG1_12854 [Fusarium avenaceum]|nr:hypothetical protein FAVG1_12854 [Fusarium avenaceum]
MSQDAASIHQVPEPYNRYSDRIQLAFQRIRHISGFWPWILLGDFKPQTWSPAPTEELRSAIETVYNPDCALDVQDLIEHLKEQAKSSKKGIVAPHMIKKANRWAKDSITIPTPATNAYTPRSDRAASLVASRESANIAPSVEKRAGGLISASGGPSTRQKETKKKACKNEHLHDDGIGLEETNNQGEEQNDEHDDQARDVEHGEINSGVTLLSSVYAHPDDDGTDSGDSGDEDFGALTIQFYADRTRLCEVAARLANERETILSLTDSISEVKHEMQDLRTAIETATESLPEKTKAVSDLEAVIKKHNPHIPKEMLPVLEKMKQGVEKAKNQVDNIRDWKEEIQQLGDILGLHNDNKRRAEANVEAMKKEVESVEEDFARSKQMRRAAILLRHINELGVRGINDLGMERMEDFCKVLEVEVDDEEDENTPKM